MAKKVLQVCAIDLSVDALLKPLILRSMQEGYIVHNACTDTGRFQRLREEGLTMIDLKIDRNINPQENFKSIIALYKLMKKEKYDIVHVHTPIAAILGRIAAKMAKVEHIVYTAHGFYFHEEMPKFQYNLFYNIEKYGARFLTHWLLLQSKEDYNMAMEKKFLPSEKVIHLSNGVDIYKKFNKNLISDEKKVSLKNELNLCSKDVIFMFIGRLVREKGIFELIEAYKQLTKKHTNCKLLLVGDLPSTERDTESYKEIKNLIRSNKGILHVGYRNDIRDLLAVSSVFVLPSYREGLPRSIIEAMAMEKPIIATNIRGCREEVVHQKNGYLVSKQSSKELMEAMEGLMLDETLRRTFGKQSRRIAEDLFDEEKVLNRQITLFNQLCAKSESVIYEKTF